VDTTAAIEEVPITEIGAIVLLGAITADEDDAREDVTGASDEITLTGDMLVTTADEMGTIGAAGCATGCCTPAMLGSAVGRLDIDVGLGTLVLSMMEKVDEGDAVLEVVENVVALFTILEDDPAGVLFEEALFEGTLGENVDVQDLVSLTVATPLLVTGVRVIMQVSIRVPASVLVVVTSFNDLGPVRTAF